MTLRATRTALEILGRGATTRLNTTRAAVEVLGRGATNRVQATQVRCEVLGEYVLPAGVVTTLRSEILGRGSNDRVQATQVQCEVLASASRRTLACDWSSNGRLKQQLSRQTRIGKTPLILSVP